MPMEMVDLSGELSRQQYSISPTVQATDIVVLAKAWDNQKLIIMFTTGRYTHHLYKAQTNQAS